MAWKFDNPLYSLSTQDQNDDARKLWEAESLGGITEDNNRLPQPVVGLLILTIITAFFMTFPLWGQRPNAAIYEEYIALMDSPEVQAIENDQQAMEYIVNKVRSDGTQWAALQERHPVEMDDLRMIRDQVIELKRQGADLREYTVLGNQIVLANFEGNFKANGERERFQPWWDKGYTIDIFFIVVFCVSLIIAVKRLPNYTWQPRHGHEH
jgi:hypothetical protein